MGATPVPLPQRWTGVQCLLEGKPLRAGCIRCECLRATSSPIYPREDRSPLYHHHRDLKDHDFSIVCRHHSLSILCLSQPPLPRTEPLADPQALSSSSLPSDCSVTALSEQLAQYRVDINELRARLEKAEQLAERASADLALLRQELHQQKRLNKRKRSAPTIDSTLMDCVFTPNEVEESIERSFTAWRLEEEDVTMGYACISAVLTLLNHHLQQANDPHVRFLPSYPEMEAQLSDDPVNEKCMGINFGDVEYVVAPVSVDHNHWALVIWDSRQSVLLLLDSFDIVKSKHGTRLRRLMRGKKRSIKTITVPVMQQDDLVSCGLFLLCFACYIVSNVVTWREGISGAVFNINRMRAWLDHLKTPGVSQTFSLEQLPTFNESSTLMNTSMDAVVSAPPATEQPLVIAREE